MNGFLLADATSTAAKQFPNIKWAITDFPRVALTDVPANAYGLTFKSEESGFLVGYLAAQMAKAKIGPKGASSSASGDNYAVPFTRPHAGQTLRRIRSLSCGDGRAVR